MNHHRKIPFQNMKGENWLNLALAALITFYVLYLLVEVLLRTMCGQLGIDYCDYVSAGNVANHYGYVKVYDLSLLDKAEKSLLPPTADPASIPVDIFPYLPVFVLPFQALALLPPEISFWIWTSIKVTALVLYLPFFVRSLKLRASHAQLLLLVFASLPVFQNIFSGQVDVWLAICVGEFMRMLLGRKPIRAGLWLGGLLIKPQALVIIGLILLVQRSTRVFAGLGAAGMLLTAASVALIGPAGVRDLAGLWLLYFKGHPSNLVIGMANWRMLGMQLASVTSTWIGYGVAGLGIMATVLLSILAWRRAMDTSSPDFAKPLLGILAATTMVAWHSHIFMGMMLIPPLLYLHSTGAIPQKTISIWVLLPAVVCFVSVFVPEAAIKLGLRVEHIGASIYVALGFAQFLVNSYLFWWSAHSGLSKGGIGADTRPVRLVPE